MKGRKGDLPVTVFPDDHPLAMLGHELGNVLNGLLGMAELLSESGLDPEQRRWLEAICHSGYQMHALIGVCRRWHGGVRTGFEPERTRFDGIELLERVLTSHTPAARERKNRLVLLTDPGLPRHWVCDACLVRQLLDNLLGNAVKFTSHGDIVVEAAAGGKDGGGRRLEFCISDTGSGIVDAVGESLFEAYKGSGNVSGDSTGDRGLGLFVCAEIVRSLRGRITCSNSTGAGARFRISLPDTLVRPMRGAAPLRSALLERVRCHLELDDPLRLSVKNFLTRLGVRPPNSDGGLELKICEVPGQEGNDLPELLLKPLGRPAPGFACRRLPAPVLESSLGTVLLEMALEWQACVRNGKPG